MMNSIVAGNKEILWPRDNSVSFAIILGSEYVRPIVISCLIEIRVPHDVHIVGRGSFLL